MRTLKQSGFVLNHAPVAVTVDSLLAGDEYDAVVFDLRLPDKRGFVLLADVGRAGNRTPVQLLTAQGSLSCCTERWLVVMLPLRNLFTPRFAEARWVKSSQHCSLTG